MSVPFGIDQSTPPFSTDQSSFPLVSALSCLPRLLLESPPGCHRFSLASQERRREEHAPSPFGPVCARVWKSSTGPLKQSTGWAVPIDRQNTHAPDLASVSFLVPYWPGPRCALGLHTLLHRTPGPGSGTTNLAYDRLCLYPRTYKKLGCRFLPRPLPACCCPVSPSLYSLRRPSNHHLVCKKSRSVFSDTRPALLHRESILPVTTSSAVLTAPRRRC